MAKPYSKRHLMKKSNIHKYLVLREKHELIHKMQCEWPTSPVLRTVNGIKANTDTTKILQVIGDLYSVFLDLLCFLMPCSRMTHVATPNSTSDSSTETPFSQRTSLPCPSTFPLLFLCISFLITLQISHYSIFVSLYICFSICFHTNVNKTYI